MIKKIMLLVGVLTAVIAFFVENPVHAQNTKPMKTKVTYQDSYPVFIAKDIEKARNFYTQWLGFEVAFESDFFILLTTTSEPSYRVGFLSEEHPSSPPSAPALRADAGVFLTLQVQNATSTYHTFVEAGITITYALTDEPWGQRRFGVTDPNGMYIDIVEQIEPKPGFWEKHKVKN